MAAIPTLKFYFSSG